MRRSGVGQARAALHLEGAVDEDGGDQPPTGYLRISLSPFQAANVQICSEGLRRNVACLVLGLMHESLHLGPAESPGTVSRPGGRLRADRLSPTAWPQHQHTRTH